jgi:hypothetical protein
VQARLYSPDINGIKDHYWIELSFKNGKRLIIDPTGGSTGYS